MGAEINKGAYCYHIKVAKSGADFDEHNVIYG